MAKGYNQVEGNDYNQMISPTNRFESIRLLVALGALEGMEMHQMNITTAFFVKCLYRLKKPPIQWKKKNRQDFEDMGFIKL